MISHVNNYCTSIILATLFVADTLVAANLIQTNSFEDGQVITNYILDSHFLRVTVSPQRGGGVTKLLLKRGRIIFNDGLSFTEQVYRHHVVEGRITEEFDSLEQSAWTVINDKDEYTLVQKTPKEVSLKLSTQPAGMTNLQVIKTYQLHDEECALYVQYKLVNTNSIDIAAGIWVNARLRTIGPDRQENYLFILPTSRGLTHVIHPNNKPAAEYYYALNPPLNWNAFVGLESGIGAVIVTEYAPLSCFRDRHILNSNRSSTDLVFRQHIIRPGQKWATQIALLPFRAMGRVDGLMEETIAYEVKCIPEGTPSNGMARVSLGMAYRGTRTMPGCPSDPITLTCKLWLQTTNNMPLAYPKTISWYNAGTNTRTLILQASKVFDAGKTVHCANTFRKPADGIYACILEAYRGEELYGQSSMPIAISDVVDTTNLVIQAMDSSKTGTECLRPLKLLNRKIPDYVIESLQIQQADEMTISYSTTNDTD